MARKPPPKMNCQKDAKGRFIAGTCVPVGGSHPIKAKTRARAPRRREPDGFGGGIQVFHGTGLGNSSSSSAGSMLLLLLGLGGIVVGGFAGYRYFRERQIEQAKKQRTDPGTIVKKGVVVAEVMTAPGHTPSETTPTEMVGNVIPIRPLS